MNNYQNKRGIMLNKRGIVLRGRKLIRLVLSLLTKNQPCEPDRVPVHTAISFSLSTLLITKLSQKNLENMCLNHRNIVVYEGIKFPSRNRRTGYIREYL